MNYHVSQSFNSFEEFNSFEHGWDTDFTTIAADNYHARIEHFAAPGILVNTGSFSAATIQRGTTPSGMRTFALPLYIDGPMYWRSAPVTTNSLMVFPENRELHAAAKGASRIFTISIAEELVADQLALYDNNVDHILNAGGALDLRSGQWLGLHRMLHVYSQNVVEHGAQSHSNSVGKSLEEDILVCLLDPLLASFDEVTPIKPEAAARNTRRALDYMLDNEREPIIIAELCNAVGISRRVLELSFKKYLGHSPKQFSNQLRLTKCHEQLQQESRQQCSVYQVASAWGFWHMGQFGSDYKKLFGQTPGTTLAE